MAITDRQFAVDLDAKDPLAKYREQFVITDPTMCYLDGNSLGRLPKQTIKVINDFLIDDWGAKVVEGWNDWIDQAQVTGDLIGRATLGAASGQVLACDTTSVNFYQLVGAALAARPGRKTIIVDAANFPTDRYILQGLAKTHGLKLITIDNESPGSAEHERITPEILEKYLSEDVAFVTLEVIQYGNSGPGAPAWLYVAKRIQKELQTPIQGWFAQSNQFEMGSTFEKSGDIRGFQIASPSLIGLKSIQSAFGMIEEAGIDAIAAKCAQGTEMMIGLYDAWLADLGFTLNTSRNPKERGGHISLVHPEAKRISVALRQFANVIPDYRVPDSIRLAIAPLPTSYLEVWDGFERIRDLVSTRQYEKIQANEMRVT